MTITPETIENLESDCIHIAEVAVGKEGGSASGVSIDTSTDRLGQVKKTLPKILEEMQDTTISVLQLKNDLTNKTDPAKGAGMVGLPWGETVYDNAANTVYVTRFRHLVVDDDWTAAIQAAIDFVSPFAWKGGTRATEVAATGGTVMFPAGVFRYTKLRLAPNLRLLGVGSGDFFSQSKPVPSGGSMLLCTLSDYSAYSLDTSPYNSDGARIDNTVLLGDDSSNGVATFVENVCLENLHIKGANTCKGFNLAGGVQCRIKNCYISGFTIPLRISASWFGSIEDVILEGSYRGLMVWRDVTTLELRNVSIEKQGSYDPSINDADLSAPESGEWNTARNRIACGIYNYYGCIHGTATIQLWSSMLTSISGRDDLEVYTEGISQTIINAVGQDNQRMRVHFQQIAKCETANMLWTQTARVHISAARHNYTESQFNKLVEYCDSGDNYDFIPRFDGLSLKNTGDPYYATGVFKQLNTTPEYQDFTPTITGDAVLGSATYSLQNGAVTKIGDMVFFQCQVSWSGHTGSGVLQVSGFPFKRNAVFPALCPVQTYSTSFPSVVGTIIGTMPSNATYFNIAAVTQTGWTDYVQLPASGNILISGSYKI